MVLDGAFRYIEIRGDLLVRTALNNAAQYFLLAPANFHSDSESASSGYKLLCTLSNSMKERIPRNHHHLIVFRSLAPDQAMHREQAGNLVDRQAAIGSSLHTESHSARGALA